MVDKVATRNEKQRLRCQNESSEKREHRLAQVRHYKEPNKDKLAENTRLRRSSDTTTDRVLFILDSDVQKSVLLI